MKKIILFASLLFFPGLVIAANLTNPTDSVVTLLAASTIKVSNSLQVLGIKVFYSLTMLQFAIIGYGQIASGEIDASLAKFSRAFLWVAFCLYLMTSDTASLFIGKTINHFLDSSIGWATGTPASFDVGGIIATGFASMGNVTKAAVMASSPTRAFSDVVSFVFNGPMVVMDYLWVGLISIIILITCGYIALKVFMIKIEAVIVLAVLPLSLSFLGLNAMREQGFAPFKSMLALVYRIVILGMVVGMISGIGDQILIIAMKPTSSALGIYFPLLSTSFGFVIAAFLTHKSDSIATSLANGSASLGSGDAVGTVMAGAAAATGGAAVASAASSGSKSMGEVMKSMMSGGGGSVTNASGTGSGGMPKITEPAPARPNASLNEGSNNGQSNKPPVRPPESAGPLAFGSTPAAVSNTAPGSNAPGGSSNNVPASSPPAATSRAAPASSAPVGASNDVPGADGTPLPGDALEAGSGAKAGIGGTDAGVAAKLDNFIASQGAPKRPSVAERMKDVGHHMAQEKSATHVSINTNTMD